MAVSEQPCSSLAKSKHPVPPVYRAARNGFSTLARGCHINTEIEDDRQIEATCPCNIAYLSPSHSESFESPLRSLLAYRFPKETFVPPHDKKAILSGSLVKVTKNQRSDRSQLSSEWKRDFFLAKSYFKKKKE